MRTPWPTSAKKNEPSKFSPPQTQCHDEKTNRHHHRRVNQKKYRPNVNRDQIDTPLTRAHTRIEEDFATMGGVTIYLSEEEVAADDWRRLMRLVAQRLGRPVETFANDITVVGALKDWPATDDERRQAKINQRRTVEALNDPL